MAFKLDYFARETLVSLRRNLMMTLAGILTVGVSLFLVGGVMLLSRMVDHGTERWKDGVELEIFLNANATEQQISAVQAELDASPLVKRYRFITKDEAYELFQELFAGEEAVLESANPEDLPPSFRVAPEEAEFTEQLEVQFAGRPGVDEVATAEEQVRRLLRGITWIRRLFFAISAVLLASSLFLIVNTIRLATFARRREIQIMKLVGATNWFIRIPFTLEGLLQGMIGAGLAFGAVAVLQQILSDLVSRSDGIFQSFFISSGDAVGIGFMLIAVGGVVGMVGSAIGLRRFLDV